MFKMKFAQTEEPRDDAAAEISGSQSDAEDSATTSRPAGPGAAALKSKVRPSLTPKRRSTPPPDGATIRQQFEAVRRYAAEPSFGIAPQRGRAASEEPSTLLIGRAISFKGRIGDCKTLIVEGRVAANAKCGTLQVQEAGVYDGEIVVETAEILGRVEGRLQVRGRLTIRAAGQVSGDVTYGELDIAAGGRLAGNIRHQPIPEENTPEENTKDETAAAAEATPPSQPVATETADKVPSVLPNPFDVEPQPPVAVAAEPSVARDEAEEAAAPTAPEDPASPAVGTAGERP